MSVQQFHAGASEEIYRRAGGRRHYNTWRQFVAAHRRTQVAQLMGQRTGRGSLGTYGWQAEAARMLGVSRATICRDAAMIEAQWRSRHACPLCGTPLLPVVFHQEKGVT